jgi:DNA-binding transcriptional regulator YhcF (GntR family)
MSVKFKYRDAAERIIEMIRSGEAVDKLPGERTIADGTGYSYMTVRKALSYLERNGIISKSPKKGTYAVRKSSNKSELKTIALIDSVNSDITGCGDLIEVIRRLAENSGIKIIFLEASDVSAAIDGCILIRPDDGIFARIPALKLVPSVCVDSWTENAECGIVCSDYYSTVYRTLEEIGHIEKILKIRINVESPGAWPELMIRKAVDDFSVKYKISSVSDDRDEKKVNDEGLWTITFRRIGNAHDSAVSLYSDYAKRRIVFVPRTEQIAIDTIEILKEIIDGGRILRRIVKMKRAEI